jgi:hypothetical protein
MVVELTTVNETQASVPTVTELALVKSVPVIVMIWPEVLVRPLAGETEVTVGRAA